MTKSITADVEVSKNTERVLFRGNDKMGDTISVLIAKQKDESCWIVYAEYPECNANQIYIGWVDEDGVLNNEDSDFWFDNSEPFKESDLADWVAEAMEEINQYTEITSEACNVTFCNETTGIDVALDFKLTQQAYVSGTNSGGLIKYTANAIAENGIKARLYWLVPADLDDVSNHDWSDVVNVEFL